MKPEYLPPIKFDPAQVVFDSLVAPDGIVFRPFYRGPYLGTVNRLHAQWLREHPGTWRYLTPEETASLRPRTEHAVNVGPSAPGSPLVSDLRHNTNGTEAALARAEGGSPRNTQPVPDMPVAPRPPAQSTRDKIIIDGRRVINDREPSEVATEIAIDGHLYISTKRLALMLRTSERTLSRRCTNSGGPPGVKLAGTYYELDKVQAWAENNGFNL